MDISRKYYFTFSPEHEDINGNSLGMYYTVIEAMTQDEAIILMSCARGSFWSFCHGADKRPAVIDEFGLQEKSWEEVMIETEEYEPLRLGSS